ncbi:DUF7147 family protein [Staphylococcus massiliensis]|uniref:DUF7147 family protein n=1 Tax=Staphylococcus massiliensis TaxID=555791 RepID=UPI001EDDDE85|nr:hypothetical protein [Staphylococcus massiliensis]MCG3400509.1 hypothetical protein [Staphylococcus massiliensis]MCG3411757.1 hypothetical protein [Staphylococcus massiliensis]
MKQSFIVLGEGLTDLYEFKALLEYNHERISKVVCFHTPNSPNKKSSAAIVMNPTEGQYFQGIYIMINAFNYPYPESNKKYDMISSWAQSNGVKVYEIDVKPPEDYHELPLYFNYLTSVLRLQSWIPPLI